MKDQCLYTKTVVLPRPMTGAEIKTALENSAGKDFQNGRSVWDEDQKSLPIGTQPSSYPYGLALVADKNGTLLAEEGTYSEIFVMSNEGWGGVVFAVIVHEDTIVKYCQEIIKNFLASID